MNNKHDVHQVPIRYSEAFKREVVRELESGDCSYMVICRKYGIRGSATVQSWLAKYGNGSRGKIIRVEKPEEINELERLKKRVRQLETALANSNIDLALERAYTQMACERAGIQDVEEFKKKADGTRHTKQ